MKSRKFSMKVTMRELRALDFTKDEEGWLNAVYADFFISIYEVKTAIISRYIWIVARKTDDGRGAVIGNGQSRDLVSAKHSARVVIRNKIARSPEAVMDTTEEDA